jgi:hypothetical protein
MATKGTKPEKAGVCWQLPLADVGLDLDEPGNHWPKISANQEIK